MPRLQKVLLVEDNTNDSLLLQRELRKISAAIEVVSFGMGELALEWLNRNTPDLILLDLKLPGISGMDFAKQVRMFKRLDLIKIVIVTGLMTDVVRASDIASEYLTKPIMEGEIRTLLNKLGFEV